MDKKEYLLKYHNLIIKIEKKKRFLKILEETSFSKSIFINDEINKLIEKSIIIKQEILNYIKNLDEDLQSVLIYRYIEYLTWNEIATKLFISIRTVYRWHKKALNLLEIPI